MKNFSRIVGAVNVVSMVGVICCLQMAMAGNEPVVQPKAAGATIVLGKDDTPFNQAIQIAPNTLAVIQAGDGEGFSFGSYTVRLYESANRAKPSRDFFGSGVLRSRDGAITEVQYGNLLDDGQLNLAVITTNVGTGSYKTADVFTINKANIQFVKSVYDSKSGSDSSTTTQIFGKLWSPEPGVLCDRYHCADGTNGLSLRLTKKYALKVFSDRLTEQIFKSLDRRHITFTYQVSCDINKRICTRRYTDEPLAEYTELLFMAVPK